MKISKIRQKKAKIRFTEVGFYAIIIMIYAKWRQRRRFMQEESMQIIPLRAGDRVKLKKNHPCGGATFSVIRVGAEVRIKCETCQRDMTVDRIKLEKSIRQLIHSESESNEPLE